MTVEVTVCRVSAKLCWESVSGWSEVFPASCCHILLYISSVHGTLDFRKILLLLSFPVRPLQELQVFCQVYCCELSVSICQSCRLLILVFLLVAKDFFQVKLCIRLPLYKACIYIGCVICPPALFVRRKEPGLYIMS